MSALDLLNPFAFASTLDPETGVETAAAPDLTDPPVAAAGIPADERRYPSGCPDGDWCRGNRTCYWDCKATGDDISLSDLCRRGFDVERFLEDIEPMPLFLQAPIEALKILSAY